MTDTPLSPATPASPDDLLIRLAAERWGGTLLRTLGLPQPCALPRQAGGYRADELAGRRAVVAPGGPAAAHAAEVLARWGALTVDAEKDTAGPVHVALLDLSAAAEPSALDAVRHFFAPRLGRLVPGSRLLLLGARPADAATPAAAATAQALDGLVRSLAKEVGRRGATANLLRLAPGAEAALTGPLGFLAGVRSAYVSGRTLELQAPARGPDAAGRGGRLQGRTAVVTGAARGLGAATAERLAEDGARVLCVDVPAAAGPLRALAARLGGEALALDITAVDAPAALVRALGAEGGLDVMVHNAGITRDRTLARMSDAEWNAVLAVNLHAVLALDAALDAAGLWREGAREVCLSSISGMAGNAGQTQYAASKAALLGYVQARAQQPAAAGMTVNAVAPGFIETDMTRQIPWRIREAGRRLNALSQGGVPRDVAEAVAFLALPESAGVNGQTLRVCGQALMGA